MVEYMHNIMDRVTNISWRTTSGATLGDFLYEYDAAAYACNNRSELTNAVASVDSDYRYDYAFDDIGNRESSSERGTNAVYVANQLNQHCSITTLTSDVGKKGLVRQDKLG